jgi:hypothetical protein
MYRKTWARTRGAVQWKIGRRWMSTVFNDRNARSTRARLLQAPTVAAASSAFFGKLVRTT